MLDEISQEKMPIILDEAFANEKEHAEIEPVVLKYRENIKKSKSSDRRCKSNVK